MKVGLYSISCSGTWYNDRPALTVEEFIDAAKKYGYEGAEIDLKRPHSSPIDLTPERCKEIKAYAEKRGMPLCAMSANNNFTSPVPEHIENELLMVKEQIRVTKDLGAPVLRLFVAWRGVTVRNGIATYEMTAKHQRGRGRSHRGHRLRDSPAGRGLLQGVRQMGGGGRRRTGAAKPPSNHQDVSRHA